ncbi:MAG: DEAD/DEAH box helicase family protein [Bowdeniella nasicola]|nr:DEAD/DEAH box helicase family protein [Bowdeniella nasicola]
MKQISSFRFAGIFRSYQQRVLDRAPSLLSDRHLHVVAAPGSGKTILGLELICRLGSPALVLVPTIAIRNQWLERFSQNFIDDAGNPPDLASLVSTDLRQLNTITVVTYQALNAAMTHTVDQESGVDFSQADYARLDVAAAALSSGIGTVCLDEAHHLRNQWQMSLTKFLSAIDSTSATASTSASNGAPSHPSDQRQGAPAQTEIRFISLTATPPYDSTAAEWNRYLQTCGDIDEEISIPELVGTGDLCPHQDYVYFTVPTDTELQALENLRAKKTAALAQLHETGLLAQLTTELDANLTTNDALVQQSLNQEAELVSFADMTAHFQLPVPQVVRNLIHPYQCRHDDSLTRPAGAAREIEDGLSFIVNNPELFSRPTWEASIAYLHDAGVVRSVDGTPTVTKTTGEQTEKILLNSASKNRAIADIVNAEISNLGDGLRQVILTDHIRANELAMVGSATNFVKVGAVPIFETVRSRLANDHPQSLPYLAVLTGSLVIVHEQQVDAIMALGCRHLGSAWRSPAVAPLCAGYVKLDFAGNTAVSVPALTRAFSEGIVRVLIGTTALLAEGWDAPCLNSLVIASFIKSYMLSNQMRGRAIRKDPNDPHKVANIWHLITIDPSLKRAIKQMPALVYLNFDVASIGKRMDTITALEAKTVYSGFDENNPPLIESGLERCFTKPLAQAVVQWADTNATTLKMSADRPLIASAWEAATRGALAVDGYEPHVTVEAVPRNPRALMINLADVLLICLAMALIVVLNVMSAIPYSGAVALVGAASILTLLALGELTYRRVYSSRSRCRLQARALLDAMVETQVITSPATNVVVTYAPVGVTVSLTNATMSEKYAFAQAVSEYSAGPISPRYLLVPKYRLWGALPFFAQAVPTCISRNRDTVDRYVAALNRAGMKARAVYTRNDAGRAFLLKARKLSLKNVANSQVRSYRSFGRH